MERWKRGMMEGRQNTDIPAFHVENLVVTALSIALLASRKVPAPLIVVGALAAGFVV